MSIQTIRNFLGDEKGTTMTEFVMTLPIFITCFVGVLQLGLFNEKSVKTWANAHRGTFQLAILPTRIRMSPHVQPTTGAIAGAATYALGGRPIHQSPAAFGVSMASEAATYAGMGLRGHWGESYARTLPTSLIMDMAYLQGAPANRRPVLDSSRMIGNSTLAKDLVDERVGSFSANGGGALAVLNGLISGSGLRPSLAAGMRYGAVGWQSSDSITVAGRSIGTHAHFNCLVPPFPLKGAEAATLPTALTRLTMENTDQYKEILGIKWSQPYPGGSLNVPDMRDGPLGRRTRGKKMSGWFGGNENSSDTYYPPR